MKPMLKIGGHDYTKWVAEGGLTPTDSDVDSSKSGRNTLDALMVRNKIGAKMKWSVTLMDIPEEVAARLSKDLKQTFFEATLLDPDAGRYLTKTYYCANRPFGAQRYDKATGKTYYVGMAFNMTEQ